MKTTDAQKTKIDFQTWPRTPHFEFFSSFEEPFFGLVVSVDCTVAKQKAKEAGRSFFLYYLHRALKAANSVENFRYRIIDNDVFLYETNTASATISRNDGTFGFCYVPFFENESEFYQRASEEIEKIQHTKGLDPAGSGQDVIHCSALPWVDFTSLSHARPFARKDSSPKLSFGKITEKDDRLMMSVSIHLHHGLADGHHVGLFVDKFQELLNG